MFVLFSTITKYAITYSIKKVEISEGTRMKRAKFFHFFVTQILQKTHR